jgi:hypothetical protein
MGDEGRDRLNNVEQKLDEIRKDIEELKEKVDDIYNILGIRPRRRRRSPYTPGGLMPCLPDFPEPIGGVRPCYRPRPTGGVTPCYHY